MAETNPEDFPLTRFARSSGCGCKIAPAILEEILQSPGPSRTWPRLLVGNGHRDDAAAYDMGDGTALVSTTDFFTPIVDDAAAFGRIAAANALSDVYAMGGTPLLALAVLGWPVEKLPAALARTVVESGRRLCEEAGIPLAGGHSVDTPEPLFGLAVTGTVPVEQLRKNSGARDGDVLLLTKPIGSGIIVSAARRGEAAPGDLEEAVRWMSTLNAVGAKLGALQAVHAMTDVTGFGLLGHLDEMCRAAGLSCELSMSRVPLMPNLQVYASRFIYPDMTMKIYSSVQDAVEGLDPAHLFAACDPQTNGGLLVAVDPSGMRETVGLLQAEGVPAECLEPVGRMTNKPGKRIRVTD